MRALDLKSSCVLLVAHLVVVSGAKTESGDLGIGLTSLVLTAGCLVLLVILLGMCVFFKSRSFDIIQPDVAMETTAAFYHYRNQLQKDSSKTLQHTTPPPLEPRVSVISLIPPDEVTEGSSMDLNRHTTSPLSVIVEEQYTPNGTAGKMVDVNGGFSVLAVPSSEHYSYTDDDYTTVGKVKRQNPSPQVLPSSVRHTNHRDSSISLDENDRPPVPPKTPQSMQFM